MKNEMKITSKDFLKALRRLLRKDIVGVSRVGEDGKMHFRFPNGQTFKISVEEVCDLI